MTAPLNRVQPTVRRGDTVRVDVVVRTKKIGHFFPGGTVDAYDTWLELKGTDDKGQTVFWSGMVGRRRQRSGRERRAFLSLAADRCARQSDQQAQCLGDARRRLCAPDSAGRRRYRALPRAHSGECRQQDHAARASVLPQICLVEHAILVRRHARSGAAQKLVTPSYDDRSSRFDCAADRVSRQSRERFPTFPSLPSPKMKSRLPVAAKSAPAAAAQDRSARLKTGSAGMTTASACSCREI